MWKWGSYVPPHFAEMCVLSVLIYYQSLLTSIYTTQHTAGTEQTEEDKGKAKGPKMKPKVYTSVTS